MFAQIIENWTCPKLKDSLETYLQMKQERNRSLSCSGRWHSAFKNGFFLKDDSLQCFCCGLQIGSELFEYNIPSLHTKYSPHCTFLTEKEPNLRLEWVDNFATYCSKPVIHSGSEVQPPLTLSIVRLCETDDGKILQINTDDFIINPERVFQLFRIRMNRVFSFATSPPPIHHRNWLIENGFFWTGSLKIIQCAYCRIAIDGRLRVNPLIIHRQLSPECPFLSEDKFDAERNLCCVCLTKSQSILYMPCAHLACCADCDHILSLKSSRLCPICRTKIEKRIIVIKP